MKLKTLMAQRKVQGCEKCGLQEGLTIDHFIPKALFAIFDISSVAENRHNLRVLCEVCNQAKGSLCDFTDPNTLETLLRIVNYAAEVNQAKRREDSVFKDSLPTN